MFSTRIQNSLCAEVICCWWQTVSALCHKIVSLSVLVTQCLLFICNLSCSYFWGTAFILFKCSIIDVWLLSLQWWYFWRLMQALFLVFCWMAAYPVRVAYLCIAYFSEILKKKTNHLLSNIILGVFFFFIFCSYQKWLDQVAPLDDAQ